MATGLPTISLRPTTDRVLTTNGEIAPFEDLDHSGRRAGRQSRAASLQAPRIHRMKAVYVLRGENGIEQGLRVDLLWERQLNENAVDVIAIVEARNEVEHFFSGNGVGRRDEFAEKAKVGARLHLAANVNLRCRHVANKDGRQSRPNALCGKLQDLLRHFLLDCRGNRGPIENS